MKKRVKVICVFLPFCLDQFQPFEALSNIQRWVFSPMKEVFTAYMGVLISSSILSATLDISHYRLEIDICTQQKVICNFDILFVI